MKPIKRASEVVAPKTITMIDIPEGYLYGFPMEFDIDKNTQSLADWLLSKGVPKEVVDECRYYRSWTRELTDKF